MMQSEMEISPKASAHRGRVLLQLIDSVDAALMPGIVFEDWMLAMFSKHKETGSAERRLYRVAILTWARVRAWVKPVLDRDPSLGLAVLYLAMPPGEVREAFACGLDLPRDTRRPLPSQEALRQLVPRATFHISELLPAWLIDQAPWAFGDDVVEYWFEPTTMWMRCRPGSRERIEAELRSEGIALRSQPGVPDALGLPPDMPVTGLKAYVRGLFEVQDIGAQVIVNLADPRPGEVWLNTFAGLGRHARAIADLVGPTGRVDVSDYRKNELSQLALGSDAHARENIRVVDAKHPGTGYDGVLAFALSSCSGLLRHRPWLFHQIDADALSEFVAAQHDLLRESAPLVRIGGKLVYAVTSLCRAETERVAAWFLRTHPGYEQAELRPPEGTVRPAPPGWRIHPSDMDSDARYLAVFRRVS